jgi:hypothetical protein
MRRPNLEQAPTTIASIEKRPTPVTTQENTPYEKSLREYEEFTRVDDTPQIEVSTEAPLDPMAQEAQHIIDSVKNNPELATNVDLMKGVNDIVSGEGYEKEKEKQQRDADEQEERAAADAALESHLAVAPGLRRLDKLSAEVHKLRNTLVTPDNDARLAHKLNKFEGFLQEELLRYSQSPYYDEALANVFMDRTDMASLDQAAKNALAEQRNAGQKRTARETRTAEVKDGEAKATPQSIDELRQDIADITARLEIDKAETTIDPKAKEGEEFAKKISSNPEAGPIDDEINHIIKLREQLKVSDDIKLRNELAKHEAEYAKKMDEYRDSKNDSFDARLYMYLRKRYEAIPRLSLKGTVKSSDSTSGIQPEPGESRSMGSLGGFDRDTLSALAARRQAAREGYRAEAAAAENQPSNEVPAGKPVKQPISRRRTGFDGFADGLETAILNLPGIKGGRKAIKAYRARKLAKNNADPGSITEIKVGRGYKQTGAWDDKNVFTPSSPEVVASEDAAENDKPATEEKANSTFDRSKAPSYSGINFAKSVWENVRLRREAHRAKDGENTRERGRIRKGTKYLLGGVGIALAAVSLAGATTQASHNNAPEHVDTGGDNVAIAPVVPGPDTGHIEPKHEPAPPKFDKDARTIVKGEGVDQTLQEAGIPYTEWNDIKTAMLTSEDPNITSHIYRMEDGQPGWSEADNNITDVLESIQKLRNK